MHETIAALATPPGVGGIGIVRVSGPLVPAIARAVTGRALRPRHAHHALFLDADGAPLDTGIALHFPAPHSFTGEHVLELHGHGGPVVLDMLLGRVLALGARPARPGEFSERAFLNDKLDLAQAEAIADLIESGSRQAARAALHSLQGEFSRRVRALVEALIELRSYVEAALDFSEEDIDFLSDPQLGVRLRALRCGIDETLAAAGQGVLLKEGMTVVIAGQPNVGKSSLINQLCGRDAAIVTAEPGTTRDVLREHLHIDGLPLHLLDTAGLHAARDAVEREGVRRAWQHIQQADLVLLVVDASRGEGTAEAEIRARLRDVVTDTVWNKIDLSGEPPGLSEDHHGTRVALSALTGAGLEALREHLKHRMGYRQGEAGLLSARRRHLEALGAARVHLERAGAHLEGPASAELAAEELAGAQRRLGEITGEFSNEELLGRIFSSFCIGK